MHVTNDVQTFYEFPLLNIVSKIILAVSQITFLEASLLVVASDAYFSGAEK